MQVEKDKKEYLHEHKARYLHKVKDKPRFYTINGPEAQSIRGLIDLKMPFHCNLSAILTLFPKINVQIEGLVKLRIVYNVVLLNNSLTLFK